MGIEHAVWTKYRLVHVERPHDGDQWFWLTLASEEGSPSIRFPLGSAYEDDLAIGAEAVISLTFERPEPTGGNCGEEYPVRGSGG